MPSVVESIEINATPKECFAVITDYEAYPEYHKNLKSVTVADKKGINCEVTYELDLIKKISYTLRMSGKAPHKIVWQLVTGDIMKKNEGYWELKETRQGVTRANYHLTVEFSLWVPGPIAKMLVGKNLPAMMRAFKQRIEG